MPVTIELVPSPTQDVCGLIAELDGELSSEYAAENRHGLSLDRIFQPNVRFFLARADEQPAGCGGVAFFDGGDGDDEPFAEIKRMYVRPPFRGRGVAAAILARLEEEARAAGVTRLMLETGDAQLAALHFYEKSGFTRRGNPFGPYAAMPTQSIARSIFLEKTLAASR